jgi:hypothetical protein
VADYAFDAWVTVEDSLIVGKLARLAIESTNSLWLVQEIQGDVGVTFLRSCTVVGALSFGLREHGATGAVADSIIVGNVRGFVQNRVEYCDVLGGFQGSVKPGRGCIASDAMFVNAPNLDFRLKPGSPCIGKASDGGDIGCRFTPEMIELCKVALDLRRRGILKF